MKCNNNNHLSDLELKQLLDNQEENYLSMFNYHKLIQRSNSDPTVTFEKFLLHLLKTQLGQSIHQ